MTEIPITRRDRGQEILDDPDAYFAQARVRAAELVARDLARETRKPEPSRRRAFWIADREWLAAVAAARERDESLSEEIRRFLRRYVRRSK